MKKLLSELGFKDEHGVYLHMLSEFVNAKLKHTGHFITTALGSDIVEYANFITQPLKKEMFVPCLNGEVLSLPSAWEHLSPVTQRDAQLKAEQYQQAMEAVLFEGCKIMKLSQGEQYIEGRHFLIEIYNEESELEKLEYDTIEQAINNGIKLYLK